MKRVLFVFDEGNASAFTAIEKTLKEAISDIDMQFYKMTDGASHLNKAYLIKEFDSVF